MDDLEEAVKKVTVGLQKNSRVISERIENLQHTMKQDMQ